ncbi:hypothetical protein [Thiothrix winogradskyi]|uniref:Uncharacterized protein n=1 Tax=Thiothrix winogradskyi TaxID=96472 RepID=A0ABY3T3V5_9GAMM|nr:hypothetical protein [Thiothrix winogradskyi]UJS26236.1 hypothetical protein L2Y54_09415 [Thiothrix winogradskyi]
MNDNTAKVLMVAILGATAVGLMFAIGSAKAESQPLDVKLISDHPYSSACATRADQLRKKGQGLRIACDCDPAATMCWAFDTHGNIIAWKHTDTITVATGE